MTESIAPEVAIPDTVAETAQEEADQHRFPFPEGPDRFPFPDGPMASPPPELARRRSEIGTGSAGTGYTRALSTVCNARGSQPELTAGPLRRTVAAGAPIAPIFAVRGFVRRSSGKPEVMVAKDDGLTGVVSRSVRQFAELTGREPESVTGVRGDGDGGWSVLVDVVELARIPDSTSVLATYRVDVDSAGDLRSYERLRRYHRGATDPT